MFQKLILLFCVLLAVLVYIVNTEKHEYVVIEDYPYHYLPCVPPANKTICHSHVALIGSQYSTVTIEFVIPIQVSIQIAGLHVCSGAFIHESWIMTAASCVFRYVLLQK
ncbi:hypothetical protein ALC57_04808 [Trachymyrmex cornetzi]|uniref:Peptidase S1 domain-containing protein n=1 Tax=Trachymyrmex cornetzi TaxID=471704 RepID=A0A195EDV3_9HYME|nr:hypothetical protein ALC57_04808 [Trachymyrmex cornetzi]